MSALFTDKREGILPLTASLCLVAVGAVLPLSTALVNLLVGLALVLGLLSGRYRSLVRLMQQNPVAQAALLLFCLFVLATLYSSADLAQRFDWLNRYRKLLLIVLFLPLLTDTRVRRWATNSFVAGMVAALVVSYGISIGLVPPTRWGASIVSPITHSSLGAFFVFLAAQRAVGPGPGRWFWGLAALAGLVDILFIITGRTGQVIVIALLALLLWQHCDWRRRVAGLAVLLVLLTGALMASERFSGLIKDTAHDIRAYSQGQSATDVGLRLEWYVNSVELLQERPVLGYGTGSFVNEYGRLARRKGIVATENPHNEYLVIGVQLGGVGMVAFLLLFIAQWRQAGRLDPEEGRLAQALVVTMALGCLANSFLLDMQEGHFYAFFTALLALPRADTEERPS